MIRQTRQMTPKRTDAGLLTSDSEPFAFFGVIWRILFGCGEAALGNPRFLISACRAVAPGTPKPGEGGSAEAGLKTEPLKLNPRG
jgi:hypothetical protein